MFNILKQAVFTSVGLAGLAKEKVEALATEVARSANLGLQEASDFKAELLQRATEARTGLESEIDQRIDHAFIQMGIAKAGVKRTAGQVSDGLQTLIDERLDAALSRLGVARVRDLQELASRVETLEKKSTGA